jgi:hypothetical protein
LNDLELNVELRELDYRSSLSKKVTGLVYAGKNMYFLINKEQKQLSNSNTNYSTTNNYSDMKLFSDVYSSRFNKKVEFKDLQHNQTFSTYFQDGYTTFGDAKDFLSNKLKKDRNKIEIDNYKYDNMQIKSRTYIYKVT